MQSDPPISPAIHSAVKAHVETLRARLGGPFRSLPTKSTITLLMKHGGFQILLKSGAVLTRLKKQLPDHSEADLAQMAIDIKAQADMFFQTLCKDRRYGIPSELISYLTFPHEGATYTDPAAVESENPNIPAVFTFVGQFVDHDLTFNGSNLFDVQTGNVADFASPQLDLDSVYGGRTYPNDPGDTSTKGIVNNQDVFNPDMSFKLMRLGVNAYDLTRWTDASEPSRLGAAYIFDPRNDENQLILHIHLLLMRVHNKLLGMKYASNKSLDPKNPADAMTAAAEVKAEVVANWQSVLLNDYLTRICQTRVLAHTLSEIQKPNHGQMKYKPAADGSLQMPHEFAIGFRFGHSMLRSAYKLNNTDPIQLFNNRDLQRKGDLRGGVPLQRDHVIDWDVFFPVNEFDASLSLKIDSKVTPVVFDLPESAIPDAIKTSGNLPFRNLVRSREIDLACGEDLADFFDIPDSERLTPKQIEPNDEAYYLYQSDVDTYLHPGGIGKPPDDAPLTGVKDTRFKTPLWYYILKEAEVLENGERLGPLGSRLISQVIAGGIFYGRDYPFNSSWKSSISGSNIVKLRDLINFVDEDQPQLITHA